MRNVFTATKTVPSHTSRPVHDSDNLSPVACAWLANVKYLKAFVGVIQFYINFTQN